MPPCALYERPGYTGTAQNYYNLPEGDHCFWIEYETPFLFISNTEHFSVNPSVRPHCFDSLYEKTSRGPIPKMKHEHIPTDMQAMSYKLLWSFYTGFLDSASQNVSTLLGEWLQSQIRYSLPNLSVLFVLPPLILPDPQWVYVVYYYRSRRVLLTLPPPPLSQVTKGEGR